MLLTNIFVHVKRLDVLEGHLASPVVLDEFLVHPQGSASGGQSHYEEFIGSRLEVIDTLHNVFCRPLADQRARIQDHQTHCQGLVYLFRLQESVSGGYWRDAAVTGCW